MSHPQSGIFAPLPGHARYLAFKLAPASTAAPRERLRGVLSELDSWDARRCNVVVGFGSDLVSTLGAEVPGSLQPAERIQRSAEAHAGRRGDALFRSSCPTHTSHFWCPPLRNDAVDLRAIVGC